MYKEVRKQLATFCFVNTVIACVIIFMCGTLTASQKTAYNIYLKEYSVLTLAGNSERVDMKLDGDLVTVELPDREKKEKLKRYLRLTPLAPLIFLAETVANQLSDCR